MQTRPWIVAHRGASRTAPANTLQAFEAAIREGADVVELDVRSTSDGRLVVIHDAKISGIPIGRLAYHDLKRTMPHVPLLEETLTALAGRIRLDVELKERGTEAGALALCRAHLPPGDYIISSFLRTVLHVCRRLDADVPLGFITRRDARAALALCRARNWPWLMLEDRLARPQILERCLKTGVRVMVWTVNDPRRLFSLLRSHRVSGVVTDVPGAARMIRQRLHTSPLQV